MQLQSGLKSLTSAGVGVYALSYDEPEALKDFRDAYDIGFTLLPDPDSKIIRQFGILNTLIDENDHPWFGIPYPGTYVLDGNGVITQKFFENNLAVRTGPEQLLRAVNDGTTQSPALTVEPPAEVSTRVYLEGETLAVSVQRDLVARIEVPAGRHVYADPAPEGSVAVDLLLDPNPVLVIRDLVRPKSQPHSLAGTGETFNVHHDSVELRLPITVNGALTAEGVASELVVSGTLRWQTCDDEICDIPASERFKLRLPVVGPVLNDLRATSSSTAREPNAAEHFQRMIERRKP